MTLIIDISNSVSFQNLLLKLVAFGTIGWIKPFFCRHAYGKVKCVWMDMIFKEFNLSTKSRKNFNNIYNEYIRDRSVILRHGVFVILTEVFALWTLWYMGQRIFSRLIPNLKHFTSSTFNTYMYKSSTPCLILLINKHYPNIKIKSWKFSALLIYALTWYLVPWYFHALFQSVWTTMQMSSYDQWMQNMNMMHIYSHDFNSTYTLWHVTTAWLEI